MTNKKVVVITGASSGMGLETAKLMADQGFTVYGGARHIDSIEKIDNINTLKLDVTDSESVNNFVETIMDQQGRIDIIINSAGYGELGPAEEISMDRIKRQFDTNFFGIVELTQLVLPIMRKQGSGRIVNISSIGGDIYSPLGAYYHASKAALQQWSDTLDMEVKQFNIRSVIVQPGGTQSAWGSVARDKINQNMHDNKAYEKLADIMTSTLADDASGMSATSADLAKVFFAAATDKNPKRRYFNNFHDHLTVIVARALPNLFRSQLNKSLRRLNN